MAVCNLFSPFKNPSGNFMMFSQYVEDITRNITEGDANYRVVPAKFVALNIDYTKADKDLMPGDDKDLNVCIPKYFQNVFENACAYGRSNNNEWNSEISKNLFWNCLFDSKLLSYTLEDKLNIVNEIMYFGDINLHAYNEHKGMGYGEVYCYIPTDAERTKIYVEENFNTEIADRNYVINLSNNLEGYKDKFIEGYSKNYFYNRDYSLSFDSDDLGKLNNDTISKYNINTIIVLYDVYVNSKRLYKNIPMGLYVTGLFENNELNNVVNKYVTTSYGVGTSYGLRICTRFSASPNGTPISETISDNANYNNLSQLMTGMGENLNAMLSISKKAIDTTQQYKELLSIFKNNRTNVPYVKEVNGEDYWFVNGKYVAKVNTTDGDCCTTLADETIEKLIENIMDGNKDNDFDYIKDPNGCDCFPWSNSALGAEIDRLDTNFEYKYDGPDYGGGTTGGNGIPGDDCECLLRIADDGVVGEYLNTGTIAEK